MAREFMASHGVDLDAIMSKIQFGGDQDYHESTATQHKQLISRILNAQLPSKPDSSLWDISIAHGAIQSIEPHLPSSLNISDLPGVFDAHGGLVTPGLCHAHIHIDKCFIYQDPKFYDLELVKGDFAEAMRATSVAKARFDEDDLLRRGRRLINESIYAGVVSMRAFVEVDEIVGLKCVHAALKLKTEFVNVCRIQICAFAQLDLFSSNNAPQRRQLIQEALELDGIEVLGSTPYVESDESRMKQCISWTIERALASGKLLDFHLDYNLDPKATPMVWEVISQLHAQSWSDKAAGTKSVCLGHCSRLTLFDKDEWNLLKERIGEMLVSFVGLPTSDLFMMSRPTSDVQFPHQRQRGTLQVLDLIQNRGLNGAIALNNIGNAFTPHGNCDPLSIATMGVGLYQATTKQDAVSLFETVSCRASTAIGLMQTTLELTPGTTADLTIFPAQPFTEHSFGSPQPESKEREAKESCHRREYGVHDLVWLGCPARRRSLVAGRLC